MLPNSRFSLTVIDPRRAQSIAREDARLPWLNQHLAAIAIVFDFVNPVLALRRLIDGGSKLGLNEFEARGY